MTVRARGQGIRTGYVKEEGGPSGGRKVDEVKEEKQKGKEKEEREESEEGSQGKYCGCLSCMHVIECSFIQLVGQD